MSRVCICYEPAKRGYSRHESWKNCAADCFDYPMGVLFATQWRTSGKIDGKALSLRELHVVYFLDQNLFHFWQQKVLPVLHWVCGRDIEFFPQPLSWVMQSQLHHVTGKSNQVQKNGTKKKEFKTCCSCDSSSVFQIETRACFPL